MIKALTRWVARVAGSPPPIPDALWQATLRAYPFLLRLSPAERERLRRIAMHFLARKEFTGAHGLMVTDAMAVAVAAQACLPLLHLGTADRPESALHWYDDFVGIVMHPHDAVARRQRMDAAGVMHHYEEVIAGEAMQRGPLMLSWSAVQDARDSMERGTNVVIHEFMHKMDMQASGADGAPPLPRGFMGTRSAREASRCWAATWAPAYHHFRDQVMRAQRFGEPAPWLDAYGATAPGEFFAVACEAHFVNPERFAEEFPDLSVVLRAFFNQNSV